MNNIIIDVLLPIIIVMHYYGYIYIFFFLTHVVFPCFMGTSHRRNGFYTVQTVFSIALHLNLALTGEFLNF